MHKAPHKNESYTVYVRDCLNQVIFEEMYSSEGELLSQIKRVYKANLLLSEEDAEGLLNSYEYDGAGRCVEKKVGDDRISYTYDSLGNIFQEIAWISETEAQIKEFAYDFKGQILSEVSKNLNSQIFSRTENIYNAQGLKTKITTGDSVSQYVYSSRQELLKHIDPEGNTTEHEYNYHCPYNGLVGTEIKTIDSLKKQSIEIQDPLERVVETHQLNPEGLLLSKKWFFYNLGGDLIRSEEDNIIKGRRQSTTVYEWTYNAVHQTIIQKENPNTPNERVKIYSYNAAGQKASHVKPDGVELFYSYNDKGLLSELHSSDNTISYRYTYDRNEQLLSIEDLAQNFFTLRDFDSKGRLKKETLGNGLSIGYRYDALDRKTLIELPDSSTIQLEYDAWHLKTITSKDINYHFDSYDNQSNLLQCTLPKSAGTLHYNYDLNQRKRSINHSAFEHIIPENGFDKIGNLLSDQIQGASRTFTYDGLYQLISEEGLKKHNYQYDSLNNRIAKDDLPCTTDPSNQLLEQEDCRYSYDLNGNRVQKNDHGKITNYSYDALNRMTSTHTSEQSLHYRYDPFDRRLSKGEEDYFYDGQNEIGMFHKGEMQEMRILNQNGGSEHGSAIAIKIKSTLLIPIHDIFGNVAMLLTSDGQPFKSYQYSAFGNELTQNDFDTNPWRFASKRYDPDTGLIYFGRRYYDPQIGRWTTPDPAEFADGLNLQAYLLNNPLNRLDAYGLWGESLWEGGLYFGQGFGIGMYNLGEGMFHSASNMGQWLNADFDYEYCGDCSILNNKMQSSWNEWQDFSKDISETPMSSLGNTFAPGCMKVYNLDSEASFGDHCSAYGEAAFDVASLYLTLAKGSAAYKSLGSSVSNVAKKEVLQIAKKVTRNRFTPNANATGSHTVFRRDPLTGRVNHYESYRPQTNPRNPNNWESIFRFDNSGKANQSHFNKILDKHVYEPHVHDPISPGGIRPAQYWEIP